MEKNIIKGNKLTICFWYKLSGIADALFQIMVCAGYAPIELFQFATLLLDFIYLVFFSLMEKGKQNFFEMVYQKGFLQWWVSAVAHLWESNLEGLCLERIQKFLSISISLQAIAFLWGSTFLKSCRLPNNGAQNFCQKPNWDEPVELIATWFRSVACKLV